MNPETVNTIINVLAEKLGTVPSELWGSLLMQAKISAINCILYLIIMTPISLYIYFNFNRWIENLSRDYYSEAKILFGSLTLIVFIVSLPFVLPNIITALLNPEYWALEQLLRALGK